MRPTNSHKTILGTEVCNDADGVHYVMVFKRPENNTDLIPNPADILRECFTTRVLEPWSLDDPAFFDAVQDGHITLVQFMDKVWQRILVVLSGKGCGFELGYKPGITGQRTLLLMSLVNPETIDMLADRVGMKIRVTRGSYNVKGMSCPKVALTLGQRMGLNKMPQKYAPVYLKYRCGVKEDFKRATKERLQKAERQIDELITEWNKSDPACQAKIRPLMRLEDVRAAIMVVMVSRMNDTELGAEHTVYEEVFTAMNECLEKTHVDLQFEVASLSSPEELLKARRQRWSPPRFLSLEQYESTELFDDFTHLDIMRLVKRRLAQFMDITALQRFGIIESFFPPHHKTDVEAFAKEWASLSPVNLIQWPGNQHGDMVRGYFGEEIAFFFDWLSYMTRMLLFPALLSILNLLSEFVLDDDSQRQMRVGFSVMMIGWVAYLTASYDQVTTSRNIAWGMLGYGDEAMTRATYAPGLRGSLRESAIRSAHWALVFVFVTETIWAAGAITTARQRAKDDPDGRFALLPGGVSIANSLAAKFGCMAVTLNIKLMDLVWGFVSSRVADKENWRTDQDLKNSQVAKSFLVKCVVYYYPFFYLAFVRDFVEGCDGDECMHELKMNLAVFIVTHIVTVIANVAFQLAQTWYVERDLLKSARGTCMTKAGSDEPLFSYIQAQACRPAYAGDTGDYMELSITLGFISMFSVVFPFLAFMAFVSNMLEMRILAFRMCRVLQRPLPRGQEGIGAWLSVMRLLTYLSAITAVGLCIFELRPLKDMDLQTKLAAFILAEHGMLLLTYLVGKAIPSKSVNDEKITEKNTEVATRILGGDAQEVKAECGTVVCLMPGTEEVLPGRAISR